MSGIVFNYVEYPSNIPNSRQNFGLDLRNYIVFKYSVLQCMCMIIDMENLVKLGPDTNRFLTLPECRN